MLIDAGYAGFANRDPDRIMAAARDARVSQLDYLLVTHFHGDHVGGVPEVVRRLPVKMFVDYGEPVETTPFAADAVCRLQARPRGRDAVASGAGRQAAAERAWTSTC